MANWNCSEHRHNSPSDVISGACDSGCVPLSTCGTMQQSRYRCVVPGGAAWAVEDPAPGPCGQVLGGSAAFCLSQRHVKVLPVPYLDDSDAAACCPASRFTTSVSVDTSSCCTSATCSQEPWSDPGTSSGRHTNSKIIS